MRTRQLLLLLTLLLVCGTTQAQETGTTWLEVAGVTLRLRSGPSTDDAILDTLRPGTALELLERGEQWSHVRRQDGLIGWAHNDYLLPFDERNRLDTHRRVGDRRLFRIEDKANGSLVNVYARLGAISEHSYIYIYGHSADNALPSDRDLLRLGDLFDKQVYQQSLDLWGINRPPAIGGDERTVILVVSGLIGPHWYESRFGLPQETNPDGIGFVGLRYSSFWSDDSLNDWVSSIVPSLAHEFRHLLHHHTGGNQTVWVNEGLAKFSQTHLGLEHHNELAYLSATSFLGQPRDRLNLESYPYNYGAGMLFTTYIYERLGLQTLRDFAAHPRKGLAALDALLVGQDVGMDADDFFADWVLTNYLLDDKREGGRYGYHLPGNPGLTPPSPRSRIRSLPAGLRDATVPYSTDYFELTPPAAGTYDRLLLDFRLKAPPPQDAWLQLVQVLPGRIDVQRFRASEYRDRLIVASLADQPERIFIAVSPFTPGARQRSQRVRYSLALREQPLLSENLARVTTTLRVRSEPEIADNILGNLQHCSFVQVLERGEEWSKVLNADGLGGWSHNDYLIQPDAPGEGISTRSCAALTRAAHDGDLAALRRLLAAGHPVNGSDIFGRTALHEAAFWGHEDILARLLWAGADVHAQDAAGLTALDEALHTRNVDSILVLHKAGARLDLADPASLPLMVRAAGQGNVDFLDLFLAEGHDVNWQDASGQTALAEAASSGQAATLARLLEAGADAQWRDSRGLTALMLATGSGNVDSLALLFDAGVDVNQQNPEGHTALTLAAEQGNTDAVTWLLLLRNRPDIQQLTRSEGRNALHLAAAAGHEEIVSLLLLSHAGVQMPDAGGWTALQLAEAAGHEAVAELLHIAATTEPVETGGGKTKQPEFEPDTAAFVVAGGNGNLAEIERFIDAGQNLDALNAQGLSALMRASDAGQRSTVLRLLLADANPNVRGNGFQAYRTALSFALRGGHDDIGAMLLTAGALPYGDGSQSALHWAAEFGRPAFARLLLSIRGRQRLYANPRDAGMQTPLFTAVRTGRGEIVDILLAAGADPNARDSNPATPLDFAIMWENVDIVKQLLAAGADPNGARGSQMTPLRIARRSGNRQIINMLIAAGAEA